MEKLCKMRENILKLSQQKEEKTIWYQNQIIILKVFYRNVSRNRNGKKQKQKKTEILMNKPAYLGLSILELSKILMYEVWYDYVKPKYDKLYVKNKIVLYEYRLFHSKHKKQMIFIKIPEKILKQDLILQIMNYRDHCPKAKLIVIKTSKHL